MAAVVTPENQLILIYDIKILEALIKGENQVLAFAAYSFVSVAFSGGATINCVPGRAGKLFWGLPCNHGL